MIPVQLTTNDHVGKTTEAHNKKKSENKQTET